ncbi:MAG TPA: nuclear transport factor 2 family protein [Candidatus Acidoferrum sp.]|nr:nuclear transport factor 2 family protein [Candidatus Acidoferrum sp.]
MRFSSFSRFAPNILYGALLLLPVASSALAAQPDPAVLQADKKFVQAASLQNGSLLTRLLDDDFTWTDADGNTVTAAEVLHNPPKPALGDETGIDIAERTYGQVGAVSASRGKVHVLRLWVQRPGGWKLLVYHEVEQLDQPSTSAGSGVKECENPCKTVPFHPANEAEQAIIASWQALETGVTAHDADAWAPHIAEEFVQISSNSDHPISKAGRIETLNKQKASGAGSAPAPLVSAKMFDFGDAVIMTCLHQPYSGKPIHVSRLWINRDGKWIMSISYQTTIQAAAAK